MKSRIFLTQLLCPQRHTILALMFEPAEHSAEVILDRLEAARKQMQLNAWCGICGSRDLQYETRPTEFATLDEATAVMQMLKAEQMETRRELEAMGLTYDSQHKGAVQ